MMRLVTYAVTDAPYARMSGLILALQSMINKYGYVGIVQSSKHF